MSDRIPCCVPFCRRTTKDDGTFSEWICSKHWPLVDRRLKDIRRKLKRRRDRLLMGKEYRQGRCHIRITRWRTSNWRLWLRMKKQAIERAAGL